MSGHGRTEHCGDHFQQRRGLTGAAVSAADAVRALQVVPLQLPIEAKFGEPSRLSYSFQF